MLKLIFKRLWLIKFLPQTIYFNYKMLPFRQAVLLPIWLYKPSFGSLEGSIHIDSPSIKTGMIRLGVKQVNLYPNSGCMIDNKGLIIFSGRCLIGNNSYISVGEMGVLKFGGNFRANSSIKVACYNSICFGDRVLVGWDCTFVDTDFHSLLKEDGTRSKGTAPISIGNDVWFGFGCKVLKHTEIQSKCVIAANTIIDKPINSEEKVVLGNDRKLIVKSVGVWHKYNNDNIDYNNR